VGNSDLLGYALHDFGHPVHMVRMRMANSDETTWLGERFGSGVSFLWVERPDSMLFAIKEAIEAGHSLALKCDRIGQSRRCEAFDFCGKKRIFPFSIYHFSILFEMPVVFATAWKVKKGVSSVIASPIFEPDLKADKVANLE